MPALSLRNRLLVAILLALIVSFSAGVGLAVWHASRSIRVELAAALDGARRSATAALDTADANGDPNRIVATFDGSRHVRATLTDAAGNTQASSRTQAGPRPPSWFMRLTDPALPDAGIPAGAGMLRLSADATNEAAERWGDLQEQILLLALFSGIAATLCAATASVSLRPLTALSQALAGLHRNGPPAHLAETGPPEIAALATAFNRLADAVHKARAQNARLQAQMADIAEEERAEIARDLHDEFGPLLFAISAFTASAGPLADAGEAAAVRKQLAAIQDATEALQRQTRDMLGRLNGPEPQDLSDALERLAAFWRNVRPEIAFTLNLDSRAPALQDTARDALYRGAQEAISNAVRHARPANIRIATKLNACAIRLSVSDDGVGGEGGAGLGLAGMRARATALGGRVDIERKGGWTITISLPLQCAAAAA